jgi:hypothetical protein
MQFGVLEISLLQLELRKLLSLPEQSASELFQASYGGFSQHVALVVVSRGAGEGLLVAGSHQSVARKHTKWIVQNLCLRLQDAAFSHERRTEN